VGLRAGVDRRIGPYRLLRELGHGGVGVVYLAERIDGAYHQQVAIKLLQRHLADLEEHRLRAERQILAQLDHPAIARLLDGGATEDGTPYLVMELVDGEPIDVYCRRHGLGLEQKIRLFLEVCAAVESAHRRLVVHRDLKPANILVDTEGRPKLLDFGVAKLLDDADQANLTRTAERRLTPGYASPEQVLGQPITTATDVYSLGTVLYELLTGHPAVSAAAASSPAQLLDAVCRQDPPRPSTAVQQRAANPERPDDEVAESLEGLGDLLTLESRLDEAEGVLRQALELRQGARADTPVPLSESQTLLGITLLKAGHLDEAESLFRSALDIRLEAFGEENRQVAKSLNNLAWVLREKGNLDEAAALYERTLALKRRVFPPNHPSLTYSLLSLAEIRAAQGDQDAALALRREALAITRKVFGEHHPDYARALGEMASQLHDMKRYDEAEAAYRRTLALQQELFPDGNMTTARTINNLAWLLEDRGDPAAAEPLFERSLALRRKLLGATHPAVAHALYNLAQVRLRLGRPEESAKLLHQALEIARSAGSAGHADAEKAAHLLAEVEGELEPPAGSP